MLVPCITHNPCPSQHALQKAWGAHKKIHSPALDSWMFCVKRGKGRSTVMPDFAWTGELRPMRISPARTVSPQGLRMHLPRALTVCPYPVARSALRVSALHARYVLRILGYNPLSLPSAPVCSLPICPACKGTAPGALDAHALCSHPVPLPSAPACSQEQSDVCPCAPGLCPCLLSAPVCCLPQSALCPGLLSTQQSCSHGTSP